MINSGSYLPSYNKNIMIKILFVSIILVIIGIFMVYSASYYSAMNSYDNQYYFLTKQIIGALLGFIAMFIFYRLDYHKLKKWNIYILTVSFVMLILVFIPGIGVANYGAKRWINLSFFTMQASEIAKFGFVIFCASYLTNNKINANNFISYVPIILIGGAICVLVILEPNMSITMCIGIVMILMLYFGGLKKKYLALIAIPAIVLVPILIIIEPYRVLRLLAFLNPWSAPQAEGFQLIQSLYSLGAGGLFGVGYLNSRQALQFLPFSESDFIFSIIGEEFGFLGCALLMFLFAFLVWQIVLVSRRSADRFGAFLAFGISAILAVQVLINIAVVTGSIPPTGVPLPFISAGSSSLIVFMSAIGVVLNINKQSNNGM